jgi:ATP-dependent DNA ligase
MLKVKIIDLFNEVCQRNLEGVVAKRKTGTYSTVSGWLKIKKSLVHPVGAEAGAF